MANQKIHEYPLERFVYGDDDYYDIDYWDGAVYQTAKILGSTIKAAMLSGIAISLTAPSAFIVGGSPVDGTGTLTLTAAGLANQYIRGDGTLATFPTSGGGGNSVNYYLNGGTAASVATYYQMSKTAVIGTGVDFSLAGNGLISQWLTDVSDPNVTEIPAGNWNFEMFFSASSAGGTPKFYIEILKYDGATFTTIADNSLVPESITSGTAIDLYLTSVPVPLTSLAIGDRLAIRVYIVDSVLGRTITHHTQDSHLCQVITTFSSGLSSINGLTEQTQYLAVGTAGTDFAINSATDTHTFNLPTASATNRGALSSANWSTFNGKQNAITLTTTGSGAATFISDTLNIPTPAGGGGVFGISNSSGVYTYYATLTLAMAAATSGQTIEMFTSVTETGAVTITLKDGVTINGNGHTYTVSNAGLTDVFETTIAGIYRIYNLTVNRTNATGGYVLNAKNYVVSIHYLDGTHFTTNKGGIYSGSANVIQKFYNGKITISGSGIGVAGLQDNEFYNFALRATSTATGNLFNTGVIYNSTFNYEGNGISGYNIDAYNCTFIARGGGHTIQNGRNVSNCSIYNFANYGNYVNCVQFNNCLLYSATSYGSYTETGTLYKNCTIVSNGNIGAVNGHHRNSAILSTAGIGAYVFFVVGYHYNCTIQSSWNNAAGHGIRIGIANVDIVECAIEVTNSSANIINALSAFTTKYANNAFKGATTAINANITQGVTNVHDLQGNILI